MTVLSIGAFAAAPGMTALEDFAGPNGANPYGALVTDSRGDLYGTTYQGGIVNSTFCSEGCGVVFELEPISGGGWKKHVLYNFCSATNCGDGYAPYGGLALDSAGNLFGTTDLGGRGGGTVFELTRGSTGWTETVLYYFCSVADCADGDQPQAGLIFDSAGNLYGTTGYGGGTSGCSGGCGTVYELSPSSNGWTEAVIYTFCVTFVCSDGEHPFAPLVFDATGNLYGTANNGGNSGCGPETGCGVVFKLAPSSGGKWEQSVLYAFKGVGDGGNPYYSSVVLDSAGNLYGTTAYGEDGVVFELVSISGGWEEKVIYAFGDQSDGGFPFGGVILDSSGNLYGTAVKGGTLGYGVIFEMTPTRDGTWKEKVLHTFTDGHDGADPSSGLMFDSASNLYGTTFSGGDSSCVDAQYNYGCGSVFEVRRAAARQ
jgi:uncharacterized repeat protein (TIGR03803 family)